MLANFRSMSTLKRMIALIASVLLTLALLGACTRSDDSNEGEPTATPTPTGLPEADRLKPASGDERIYPPTGRPLSYYKDLVNDAETPIPTFDWRVNVTENWEPLRSEIMALNIPGINDSHIDFGVTACNVWHDMGYESARVDSAVLFNFGQGVTDKQVDDALVIVKKYVCPEVVEPELAPGV